MGDAQVNEVRRDGGSVHGAAVVRGDGNYVCTSGRVDQCAATPSGMVGMRAVVDRQATQIGPGRMDVRSACIPPLWSVAERIQ